MPNLGIRAPDGSLNIRTDEGSFGVYARDGSFRVTLVGSNPGFIFKRQTADAAVSDNNTVQPWFPTAGAVTVAAGQLYHITGELRLASSTTTTSHSVDVSFGGTATLTNIQFRADGHPVVADAAANSTNNSSANFSSASGGLSALAATTAGTSILIDGTVLVNAAGTIIPQFKFSAAPGQTPKVLIGTYFAMAPISNPTGTWA